MTVTKRKSNIELLRIILILMIIILHYFNGSMGGLLSHVTSGTFNYYLSHFLESFCIIAVNVFIIITGYFSFNKSAINTSKVIRLFLIMVFWGIVLSIVTTLFLKPQSITLNTLKQMINASLTQWFVIIYCILYLLIPYINIIINKISKHNFEILLLICTFFFYILPTISNLTIKDGGYGITNFICLYLFGAYIHKYHNQNIPIIKSTFIFLSMSILTTCFSFIAGRAWAYCTIFNLIASIAFFEIFKSINVKQSYVINKLATYTFSVYLIDVNMPFNSFLYQTLFHSNQYWNNNFMILNLIITTLGIYILCIILDVIRKVCFSKVFNYLSNNLNYCISISNEYKN